jgi:hypothetical protein
MKTTKIFTAASLFLVLALGMAMTSNSQPGKSKTDARSIIHYEVSINFSSSYTSCQTYLVEIVDERGTPVAHPQVFVPGAKKYTFTEILNGPATSRTAKLDVYTGNGIHGCPINLIAEPDAKKGPFFPNTNYRFTLTPVVLK